MVSEKRIAWQNVFLWLGVLFAVGIILVVIAEWKFTTNPLIRNLMQGIGATLITATIIGFVLETRGWRSILQTFLLDILTEPQAVRGMKLSHRGIKDKIRGLIQALYPKADMPVEFYRSIETNVIDKLTQPIRENYRVAVELKKDNVNGEDVIVLILITSYTIKNYSGEEQPLLGEQRYVVNKWIDVPVAFQGKTISADDLCKLYKFGKLNIGGQERKDTPSVKLENGRIIAKLELSDIVKPKSEEDYCATEVSFSESLTFDLNDVYFIKLVSMTWDLHLDLRYPSAEFDAYICPLLPPYAPYDQFNERTWSKGHKCLNIKGLLSPGYSVAIYWRRKVNTMPGASGQ